MKFYELRDVTNKIIDMDTIGYMSRGSPTHSSSHSIVLEISNSHIIEPRYRKGDANLYEEDYLHIKKYLLSRDKTKRLPKECQESGTITKVLSMFGYKAL
jgi:hypothetical protein